MASRVLRRSLAAPLPSTAPASSSAFVLPCKKLVLSYSEQQGSHRGMRAFLGSGQVARLAERYPSVEVVVERNEKAGRHPQLRGVYLNGRTKEICVRNLPPSGIAAKAQLLLDSSGAKIVPIRRPSVQSTTESVRGVWSAFHEEQR
ncbi:mitochondrial 54S ribosomal protein mL43 MRPL51 [Rhodotorula paludigena]